MMFRGKLEIMDHLDCFLKFIFILLYFFPLPFFPLYPLPPSPPHLLHNGLFLKSLCKAQSNFCLSMIQKANPNKIPFSFLRLAKMNNLGNTQPSITTQESRHSLQLLVRVEMGGEVDNVL